MDKEGGDDIITGLEKVNAIIDLCIDRELYHYIDKILDLSPSALEIVSALNEDGQADFNYPSSELPFLNISLPKEIISPRNDLPRINLSHKDFGGKDGSLLRSWSHLFWAKRIRAELLKKNVRPWVDRYDDLTLFLEVHMPREEDRGCFANNDLKRTLINFLMELSAISQGEASLGYAERARPILKKGLGLNFSDPQRAPYDRWISYNKGIACQHMVDRNQHALLEFNWVIKEFWKDGDKKTYEKDDDALEFLLNIAPATLQRAAIYLKLQLAYHTLQTLAEKRMNNWLEHLSNVVECKLFRDSAAHLIHRVNLYKLEALIQLGCIKDAEDHLFKETYRKVFKKREFAWSEHLASLPLHNHDRLAIQNQLVEHTVFWFLEKTRTLYLDSRKELQDLLKDKSIDTLKAIKNFEKGFCLDRKMLAKRLEVVRDKYWNWATENYHDERVYFSRWAQFLKATAEHIKNDSEILNILPQDIPGPVRCLEKTLLKCNKMIIDALVVSTILCKIFLCQFFEEGQILPHFSYRV